MKVSFRIIVSHYYARPVSQLLQLLASLESYWPDVTVVVNSDTPEMSIPSIRKLRMIRNDNVGMNIGAWNAGFLDYPQADYYLFLQDECFLKRDTFREAVVARFKSDSNLGMLGESINSRWRAPWDALLDSSLNLIESGHYIGGVPSKRVDTYLNAMRTWGINPGLTGEHLRSLVWAFPGDVLRKFGSFPIGQNRGDCIAAEISVSRKIIDMGLKYDQFTGTPFTYFGHSEWRADGLSKSY